MHEKNSGPEPAPAPDRIEQLIDTRAAVYGEPVHNMRALGLMWTGLIQQYYGLTLPHVLPGHVAALMMLCIKASRAARPVYHADNYDDGHAFLKFAQDGHSGDAADAQLDRTVESLKQHGWTEKKP